MDARILATNSNLGSTISSFIYIKKIPYHVDLVENDFHDNLPYNCVCVVIIVVISFSGDDLHQCNSGIKSFSQSYTESKLRCE